MQGNPNPSPETRFKPGQSGNPGGKTAEHRKAEVEAAEAAAQLQLRLVMALTAELDKLEAGDPESGAEANPTAAVGAIKGDVLRLLKDAQDRAFGAPTQPLTSPDGSMTPKVIERRVVDPKVGDA